VPDAVRPERKGANVAEFSVSELSGAVKRTLEGTYGHVRVRGEISGYRGPHSSGHCYFALKDDKSKIEAVVWRGVFSSLRFKPEEGMEVIATGKVSSFPGSSKYQIVIEALEPAGVGALMALLEARKKKMEAEGLFADARKKPIPFLPRVIGIITSPTGAVIRDMMHGFNERFPAHVLLWPVRVQGETCAAEVTAAIRGFNAIPSGGKIPRPDVLIVARGGGSLEDLWGFNEEIVARAAAESDIPLISAVGHETDWTLIDLVADARAPTPTKAAEWAVPKYSELIDQTAKYSERLRVGLHRRLEQARSDFRAASRGLPRLEDLIALPRQRFDAASQRLSRALSTNTDAHAKQLARVSPRLQLRLLEQRLARATERLDRATVRGGNALERVASQRRTRLERTGGRLAPQLLINRIERARDRMGASAQMLQSLSYQSVLRRGFALVRNDAGDAVRAASAIADGARLTIEFADGDIAATAFGAATVKRTPPTNPPTTQASPRAAATAAATRTKPRTPPGTAGSQGSLF
jgi:exodeoxyribonuclease VII large subunit